MSHRRRLLKDLLKHSQTRCRTCGSTEIMLGKKHGLCKSCRTTMPRPRSGWRDANGEHIKVLVYQCKCGKVYGRSDRSEAKDECPQCGSVEREVIERW